MLFCCELQRVLLNNAFRSNVFFSQLLFSREMDVSKCWSSRKKLRFNFLEEWDGHDADGGSNDLI